MLVIGIITGLIILILLVAVHELGHGIAARRNGVVVEEFGIGFPPRAWGKKLKKSILGKDVQYTLNWLPLGGFVKLQGEHDAADKKGDYGAASYWVKTKILLAGVVMNWVIAIALLTILALFGLPKILENQFTIPGDTIVKSEPIQLAHIVGGSPADKAGLRQGDQLLRINGVKIASSDMLSDVTKRQHGETVEIIYARKGTEYTTRATLRESNDNNQGYLGVSSSQRQQLRATWSAPIVGVGLTAQFTWVTLKGTAQIAWDALKGFVQSLSFNKDTREQGAAEISTVSKSVAGPVGILGVIFPEAQAAGLGSLVFLTAIISLSLAVMNILPIPALDGGRWWTMTYYRLRRKKLTKEREERIQTIGFMVLMALVVLVTWADVGKLFR